MTDHIYTTDYYQQSAFKATDQIISIYYKVNALEPIKTTFTEKPFDFSAEKMIVYEKSQKIETFRFVDLARFSPEEVTLPIDKLVAKMIIWSHRNKIQ